MLLTTRPATVDVEECLRKRPTRGDEEIEDTSDASSSDISDNMFGESIGKNFPVRLVVRAEKIPSTKPLGPNGTWTCDQEGCNFFVRSADEEGERAD